MTIRTLCERGLIFIATRNYILDFLHSFLTIGLYRTTTYMFAERVNEHSKAIDKVVLFFDHYHAWFKISCLTSLTLYGIVALQITS